MSNENYFKNTSKPICVGIGLITLDLVINQNTQMIPKLWAGGSCGNVLTILSYLGWDSYPIAKLKNDIAADILINDLKIWHVKTSLIQKDEYGSTPIIVEKISINRNGVPCHKFEWICPNCGKKLPKYKSVPIKNLPEILKKVSKSNIFYFDRFNRTTIELAKIHKENGSLIFFEPSSIKDKDLFIECLKIADIVKYSSERLSRVKKFTDNIPIPLEIETLGSNGLRYRVYRNKEINKNWEHIKSYNVGKIVDTVGAGDWCSAGIIHSLYNNKNFNELTIDTIKDSLKYGQALAALKCKFEGARGVMYYLDYEKIKKLITEIQNDTSHIEEINYSDNIINTIKIICPNCSNIG